MAETITPPRTPEADLEEQALQAELRASDANTGGYNVPTLDQLKYADTLINDPTKIAHDPDHTGNYPTQYGGYVEAEQVKRMRYNADPENAKLNAGGYGSAERILSKDAPDFDVDNPNELKDAKNFNDFMATNYPKPGSVTAKEAYAAFKDYVSKRVDLSNAVYADQGLEAPKPEAGTGKPDMRGHTRGSGRRRAARGAAIPTPPLPPVPPINIPRIVTRPVTAPTPPVPVPRPRRGSPVPPIPAPTPGRTIDVEPIPGSGATYERGTYTKKFGFRPNTLRSDAQLDFLLNGIVPGQNRANAAPADGSAENPDEMRAETEKRSRIARLGKIALRLTGLTTVSNSMNDLMVDARANVNDLRAGNQNFLAQRSAIKVQKRQHKEANRLNQEQDLREQAAALLEEADDEEKNAFVRELKRGHAEFAELRSDRRQQKAKKMARKVLKAQMKEATRINRAADYQERANELDNRP